MDRNLTLRDAPRMTRARVLRAGAALLPALFLAAPAIAADNEFKHIADIQIPGVPLQSFDISFDDPVLDIYLFADRSNASVDVIDNASLKVLFQVGGFTGVHSNHFQNGPDGVVVVNSREIWAGDGNSTVKVIDILTHKVTASISTGGQFRSDEMAFDPVDQQLLVANDGDTPPFISIITTKPSHAILKRINLPNATNGLEQPVYNPSTGLYYMSIPELNGNVGHGEILIIDPHALAVVGAFPVACEPAGLALGPAPDALVGCSDQAVRTMNLTNGVIDGLVHAVSGADEVWFNPGDNSWFAPALGPSGGTVLGVIDAAPTSWDQNLQIDPSAHSVAADQMRNHVFVPQGPVPTDPNCLNGCVAVFGPITTTAAN